LKNELVIELVATVVGAFEIAFVVADEENRVLNEYRCAVMSLMCLSAMSFLAIEFLNCCNKIN
jgi:hypothetical protein